MSRKCRPKNDARNARGIACTDGAHERIVPKISVRKVQTSLLGGIVVNADDIKNMYKANPTMHVTRRSKAG